MLFEVQDGSFSYPNGRQILRDINFQFESESIMSVLGANGAGKTTLLRCMLGLQKWQHGKTLIDGVDAKDIPNKVFWSNIGYVPQAKMPSFVYTVADMVVLGRSSHMGDFARPSRHDWQLVHQTLETVGIAHLANKLCNEISGGEYQLALVARALVSEPKMLVLDEPESNLDFRNQVRILNVLRDLSVNHGIGSIVNTHFPAHALEISNHSLLMLNDNRSCFGPTKQVITESNLSESFGVPVRIIDLGLDKRPNYSCVVAILEI